MKYKITLIILVVLMISACSDSTEIFQERIDLASRNEGDVVIGVAWDFRNDLFEEGIDLAVEEINANGGVLGHFVQLVKKDDESTVSHGLSVAQSFSNDPNIVAVIGHRKSAISIPASAIYENAGILMLTPSSTSPKLTNQGNKLIFSSFPNDDQIGTQMAQYARSGGYRNMALFYKEDAYGRGLANAFEDGAQENGINIVNRLSSYSDLNDLKRIVDMWMVLDVESVFLAEDMPEGAELIAQLRQVGMDKPIYSGNTLDSKDLVEIGGTATEGTVVASVFNPNNTGEKTVTFVKKFNEKYQVMPNHYAAQGYDAVYLLANAIETAGARVPEKVATTLKEMDVWTGVTGNYSFNSNGSVANKPIVKKIIKQGQFEYLNEGGG